MLISIKKTYDETIISGYNFTVEEVQLINDLSFVLDYNIEYTTPRAIECILSYLDNDHVCYVCDAVKRSIT